MAEQKPNNENVFVDRSPLYRALLKAGEAAIWTILLNVALAVISYFSNHETINWRELGLFAAGAAGVGVLMALSKYFTASRQPLLSQTIESLIDVVARRYGLPLPEQEAAQALDERPAYLRKRTTNAEEPTRRKNPRADDWTRQPP